MSNYVELEIQNLLNSMSDPTELPQLGEQLLLGLENSPDQFTSENIQTATLFLINAGLHRILIEFYLRQLNKPDSPFFWSHFLQSISTQKELFTEKLEEAVLDGLEEMKARDEASKSPGASELIPELKSIRQNIKADRMDSHQERKRRELDQLITLRTQQLFQEEKALLNRLQKLYPGDREILNELAESKQRYAIEVLQRHSPQKRRPRREEVETLEPDVAEALKALNQDLVIKADENPEVALDLCVLAIMIESYETALQLLDYCEETPTAWWLRLEILLKCRRYLELLTDVSKVELLLAHEAETFFAGAYLRAQALWGLGQKHAAIEVMEGLISSRPNYRSASSFLDSWSNR